MVFFTAAPNATAMQVSIEPLEPPRRYFTTEKLLNDHWTKKPEHRIDVEALLASARQAREGHEALAKSFCYLQCRYFPYP